MKNDEVCAHVLTCARIDVLTRDFSWKKARPKFIDVYHLCWDKFMLFFYENNTINIYRKKGRQNSSLNFLQGGNPFFAYFVLLIHQYINTCARQHVRTNEEETSW